MADSNTPIWPVAVPVPMVNPLQRGAPRPLQTEFETGRIRARRVYEETEETYEVSWNLKSDQFEAFKAFFEDDLEHGSLSFLLEIFGEELEVVFYDSNYSFSHSDGCYAVVAVISALSLPT